jgi:hypothetical protein
VDIFGIGTNLNTNVIVCVTLMLAMETRTFTLVHVFFSVASVLIWFIFIIIYGSFTPASLSSFYSYYYPPPLFDPRFISLPFVTRRQIFILLLPLSRNGIIPNVLADHVVDQRDGHHAHFRHEVVVDAVSAFTLLH